MYDEMPIGMTTANPVVAVAAAARGVLAYAGAVALANGDTRGIPADARRALADGFRAVAAAGGPAALAAVPWGDDAVGRAARTVADALVRHDADRGTDPAAVGEVLRAVLLAAAALVAFGAAEVRAEARAS